MWEGIVEKLLVRYLSAYVDGIEREKLQVGLLSGDFELTDLTIKPEAADALGFAFSVVFGRIGRLSIKISWTQWMAQNYDLRLTVEHVHLLLKPRLADRPTSTSELREQLRKAKEVQVKQKEQSLLDLLRDGQDAGQATSTASKHGTFFMRLTNRLMRNIEIDVKDVHIAFHDATRGFTLGCLLDQGSLFSCDPLTGEKKPASGAQSEVLVSKCARLRGLSAYGGTGALPGWDQVVDFIKKKEREETQHQHVRITASALLFKMQAALPAVVAPTTAQMAGDGMASVLKPLSGGGLPGPAGSEAAPLRRVGAQQVKRFW